MVVFPRILLPLYFELLIISSFALSHASTNARGLRGCSSREPSAGRRSYYSCSLPGCDQACHSVEAAANRQRFLLLVSSHTSCCYDADTDENKV